MNPFPGKGASSQQAASPAWADRTALRTWRYHQPSSTLFSVAMVLLGLLGLLRQLYLTVLAAFDGYLALGVLPLILPLAALALGISGLLREPRYLRHDAGRQLLLTWGGFLGPIFAKRIPLGTVIGVGIAPRNVRRVDYRRNIVSLHEAVFVQLQRADEPFTELRIRSKAEASAAFAEELAWRLKVPLDDRRPQPASD